MVATKTDKSEKRNTTARSSAAATRGYFQPVLAGLAMAALIAVVYIPAMRAGFVWDDNTFLTENQLIKASDGLYRFWFTTDAPDYFPLTSSMLWIEWRLWGMDATGYHIVNVLLHAISAVLVWQVLKQLNIPGAWLAGLIFGIHPVNVESVAWITERKNTLPMVFYLTSILLYLSFENRHDKRYYWLALFAFLLALLSKTSVVMLPFVLLIVAWWQHHKLERRDIIKTTPFFCLAIVFGLVTRWFQYHRAIIDEVVREDGFFARLAGAGWAVWFYLAKALIPYKLTFVYPRWQIDPASVVSYLPLVALGICFILFWRYRSNWGRPLLAGLGYFVITLLPVLGFMNIYFMRYSLVADHWQYTSIIGIIALMVGTGAAMTNRHLQALRTPGKVLAVAIVAVLSFLSWRQTHAYTNIETLWRDTIHKNPSAWMAHNNLGMALENQKRYKEALACYDEAMRLRPDLPQQHYNRGKIYNALGDHAQAIQNYNRAIELDPKYSDAYNNRGIAYDDMGDTNRAIQDYTKAIEVNPNNAEAYNNRGYALTKKGDFAHAIPDLNKAIELRPDYAIAYSNRGSAYAQAGDFPTAINEYTKAIELDPTYTQSYNNRGAVFFAMKEFNRAWTDVKTCQQLGGRVNPGLLNALTQATSQPG